MSDQMITNTMPELPDYEEPPFEPTPQNDPAKDWMAIVSLVVGILSICGAFIPLLGCIIPVIPIVLGILGLRSTKKMLAIVGLAIAGIGLLVAIILGILYGIGFASYLEFMDQPMNWDSSF